MPDADWLEQRKEFMRDLEEESVTLRQRADGVERRLHELGESLQGETSGSGEESDPRVLRYIAAKCRRASAEADNLTEELRGLISLDEDLQA